jgi:hypothetical protein
MKRFLTTGDVMQLLKKAQGAGSARTLAKKIGVTPQFLCDVYRGRRDLGEQIPSFLGLVKRVTYEILYERKP